MKKFCWFFHKWTYWTSMNTGYDYRTCKKCKREDYMDDLGRWRKIV